MPTGWVESSRLPLCCSKPSQAAMSCPPQIYSNNSGQSICPTGHVSAPESPPVGVPAAWCLPCTVTVGAGGEPARRAASGYLRASVLLWQRWGKKGANSSPYTDAPCMAQGWPRGGCHEPSCKLLSDPAGKADIWGDRAYDMCLSFCH